MKKKRRKTPLSCQFFSSDVTVVSPGEEPSRWADEHEKLGKAAAQRVAEMAPGERRRWLARQRRKRR